MKWKHPLRGRTIREAISDVFDCYKDEHVWTSGLSHKMEGGAYWGIEKCKKYFPKEHNKLHSWSRMKDCLRFGFVVCDNGEIVPNQEEQPVTIKEV